MCCSTRQTRNDNEQMAGEKATNVLDSVFTQRVTKYDILFFRIQKKKILNE